MFFNRGMQYNVSYVKVSPYVHERNNALVVRLIAHYGQYILRPSLKANLYVSHYKPFVSYCKPGVSDGMLPTLKGARESLKGRPYSLNE